MQDVREVAPASSTLLRIGLRRLTFPNPLSRESIDLQRVVKFRRIGNGSRIGGAVIWRLAEECREQAS